MRLPHILCAVAAFVAVSLNAVAIAEDAENELDTLTTTTDLDATLFSTSTAAADEIESTSDYSSSDEPSTTDEASTMTATTTDAPSTTETTTIDEIESTQPSTTETDTESTTTDATTTEPTAETTAAVEAAKPADPNQVTSDILKCKEGLLLPFWESEAKMTWGDRFSHGFFYILLLGYLFLGESGLRILPISQSNFVFSSQEFQLCPIGSWRR